MNEPDQTHDETHNLLRNTLRPSNFRTIGDWLYASWPLPAALGGAEGSARRLWSGALIVGLVSTLLMVLIVWLTAGRSVLDALAPLGVGGAILMHFGLALYAHRFRAFRELLVDHVIDHLDAESDRYDLTRWLSLIGSPWFMTLLSLVLTLPMAWLIFTGTMVSDYMREPSVFASTLVIGFGMSAALAYFVTVAILPLRFGGYRYRLFAVNPSSCELVARLGAFFDRSILVIAFYAALLTYLIVGIEFAGAGVAFLLIIWLPLAALYFASEGAINNIVNNAKWDTLRELQSTIESMHQNGDLTDEGTLSTIQRLIDYHDRIAATRNSTFNVRSLLTFINSLLLPLAAFLLANADRIGVFLQQSGFWTVNAGP